MSDDVEERIMANAPFIVLIMVVLIDIHATQMILMWASETTYELTALTGRYTFGIRVDYVSFRVGIALKSMILTIGAIEAIRRIDATAP